MRVLVPAEDTVGGRQSDTRTVSSLHGTPYGISAQVSSLPAPVKRGHQDTGLLPGFRVRRTTRLVGPWEVYAIDGWVLDRSRGRKCIVTSGERPVERERDPRDGILVDEYVPVPNERDGMETDDEDAGGMTWRDHLRVLRQEVEADGGRLIEIDWTPGNANDHTLSRTKTYLPVTQLPYLAHGLHPIHIPSGNYKQVKERLCMNLNLRRMGCSGRSSVGLAAPRSVLLLLPSSTRSTDISRKARRQNINSSRNTASRRRPTDQQSNPSSSNSVDSCKRHCTFTACTVILPRAIPPRTRTRTWSRRMG